MKKDLIINLIITIGISLTSFVVNKYFAFYLGKENLGLMKLFTQMLNYLNLAEIGIASASTYAFYKPLAKKNYEKVAIVLNTVTFLYNRIFFFILISGLLLNPIIPFFIKNSVNTKIYLYWSLYVISTALNYIFIKYSILFTADQKYGFTRLVEGGSRIFSELLQIFVIIKYQSFLGFIVLLIMDKIIQYIFFKHYYTKNYNFIKKTKQKDNSIIFNLKNLFWHKLSAVIVHNTDFILISKFISLEIVGIYASYFMIVRMVIILVGVFSNVLRPKIGQFIAFHNTDEIFEYFRKLNIIFLSISIFFIFTTYKLINDFIYLWLGKDFILPRITIVLMMINLFVHIFKSIIDVFKEGSGFFDDIYLPILEFIINFVVSIILVQYLGLNGVIIGTICSNILIIFIARPILVFKRCFNRNLLDYIKIYGNYLFLLLFLLFALNLIIDLIDFHIVDSWLYWIYRATIVSLISSIIIFIVFFSNKDFKKGLKMILNKVI